MVAPGFVISIAIAAAVTSLILVLALSGRRRERMARLDILRSALQHPQLDEITRAQLLRALARPPRFTLQRAANALRVAWFSIGWLMLVGGGATWLLGTVNVFRIWEGGAAAVMVAGFAMLSLPLGLREFARRERPVADEG